MTISNDAAARAAAAAAAREAARRAAAEAAKKAAAEAAKKAAAKQAAEAAASKLEQPRMSAPRPVARPSTPEVAAKINASTGRTSSFESFRPPPVALERSAQSAVHHAFVPDAHSDDPRTDRDHGTTSEGRGTNDDSVGRGTNDDSVGRGTNDDSVGRGTNDDSVGRGTNDDSVGRGTNDDSVGRGTNDDSVGNGGPVTSGEGPDVGAADEPTNRGTALVPGRKGLSPETATQMDELATGHSDRARQAQYVFNTPEFEAMSPEQRTQIVNVMSAGNERVGRCMAEMFEQSGGAMLTEKGKGGVTVLDSLERISQSPYPEVAGDVMMDLVRPGNIRQGRAPTCTVTSMQYELAHEAPGEYARLMEGLVTNGTVTMLGGGELVTDAGWAMRASQAANDGRSTSEAIFQAAAMEFANGADIYLEYGQESIGKGVDDPYRGLHADQIRTMVGELFGVNYETREIGSDKEADDELNELLARERPSRPVLFDIMIDGQDSNHLVSLEGVRNGHVYYRDPTTGERERMPIEEFRQSLVAVHYAVHATGFFDKVGSIVGGAASAAVSGATKVAGAVGDAVGAVGNAASDAASSAGKAIGSAVGRFTGLFS